jgi:preprotein translocase subunit SecE
VHRTPNPGVGGSSPSRPARERSGAMFKKISNYFGEVRQELSKVSWPSREELYGSVVVVVVLCLILAIFVYGVDLGLNGLFSFIF